MMKKIKYKGKELLPPKSDIVFKAIFADESNKDLLARFLSDMLDLDIQSGSDIEVLNSEQIKQFDSDKSGRLDIRVTAKNREQIDVEIQLSDEHNMRKRAPYYNSKLLSRQLATGEDYEGLGKTISLIILDYILFNSNENWYNCFRLINRETGEELTDIVELNFVELPKSGNPTEVIKNTSSKEKWVLFLNTEDEKVIDQLSTQNQYFDKAVKKLVYVSEDDKTRYLYDMEEKAKRDAIDRIVYAENRGLKRGIEQGIEQKALEAAINLKKAGIDTETIATCVGLPAEIVESLSIEED